MISSVWSREERIHTFQPVNEKNVSARNPVKTFSSSPKLFIYNETTVYIRHFLHVLIHPEQPEFRGWRLDGIRNRSRVKEACRVSALIKYIQYILYISLLLSESRPPWSWVGDVLAWQVMLIPICQWNPGALHSPLTAAASLPSWQSRSFHTYVACFCFFYTGAANTPNFAVPSTLFSSHTPAARLSRWATRYTNLKA